MTNVYLEKIASWTDKDTSNASVLGAMASSMATGAGMAHADEKSRRLNSRFAKVSKTATGRLSKGSISSMERNSKRYLGIVGKVTEAQKKLKSKRLAGLATGAAVTGGLFGTALRAESRVAAKKNQSNHGT